jgi:hypothetical protein
MVDLEQSESDSSVGKQWFTVLQEREVLIDITIFGYNFVVTLSLP